MATNEPKEQQPKQADVLQQNPDGSWSEAKPLEYPSMIEDDDDEDEA